MKINNLYSNACSGLQSLLHPLCTALFLLLASGLLFSCEDYEDYSPALSDVQELTASTSELVLKESKAKDTALKLDWTAGTNHGTDAAIEYIVQFDTKGNNFANPVDISMGKAATTSSYSTADLNNLLTSAMGLAVDVAHQVEVRVKALEASGTYEPDYSNVVALTLTPYKSVTKTLYMIGNATPNGWSADNATELKVDANNPVLFKATVQLAPGNFKFITAKGSFLPSYNKGADASTLVYRSEDSQPDEPFVVTEGGLYAVTANLEDLTLTMQKQEGPDYTQLWLIGGATPGGWSFDDAVQMVQSEADPFVFTSNVLLSTKDGGELKIATAKDWGALFYRPTVGDAPLSSEDVQLSAGDPDNKWKVTETGMYKITLDTRDMTISFDPIDLYLIGDAGTNGWNIEAPEAMAKNGSVYTYTGALKAGEFKISMFKGDWCGGDWINAATESQAISNTSFITTNGCEGPDNKWKVSAAEAGDYVITVDLATGTMTIARQ